MQSLASKLHETNEEHQQLRTANERQLRLEAQALRAAQQQEQQAAQMTHEHEDAIRELRRQAEEQPENQKRLWKRQLSQQSTYKAEIHELYTEMLNMREKSAMQSHLAANMCSLNTRFQAEVSNLSLRMSSTLDLQADVLDGYFQRN